MAIFKCKMCGGTIEFNQGDTVGVCDSCGTKQTLPQVNDEKIANLFNRANQLRLVNRFDESKNAYEQILLEDNKNAEAHWGIILAKYGIEYIDDAKTGKKIPTCHRTLASSIFNDVDYIETIKNADEITKSQYEKEAQEIAIIQKGILEYVSNAEKYDVFICYKETDDDTGKRTQDSVIAQDLYYELDKKGYKTFFSRKSLENKLGNEYEPLIFSALSTAKVMVVLGTKAEHFESTWLKNEWSRFLEFTKNDSNRILIPAYKGLSPYSLPSEFSSLQALDMDKIGFVQDLIDAIERVSKKQKQDTNNYFQNNTTTGPIVERAYMFLEDKEWAKAIEYAERALDMNPKCGDAYFCKFLVSINCNSFNTCIKTINKNKQAFAKNGDYQKAKRFADVELKAKIEQLEITEKDVLFNIAIERFNAKDYSGALNAFKPVNGYKNSRELIDVCNAKINQFKELNAKLSNNQQKIKELEYSKTTKQNEIQELNGMIAQLKSYTREKTTAIIAIASAELVFFIGFFVNSIKVISQADENANVDLTINDWLLVLFLFMGTVGYVAFAIMWPRYKKKTLNENNKNVIVAIVLSLLLPSVANVIALIECFKILVKKNRKDSNETDNYNGRIGNLSDDIRAIDQQVSELTNENYNISMQLNTLIK